jgi:hypothetical protein
VASIGISPGRLSFFDPLRGWGFACSPHDDKLAHEKRNGLQIRQVGRKSRKRIETDHSCREQQIKLEMPNKLKK